MPFSGIFRTVLALILLTLLTSPATAGSWADLDEGEHEIYGREREEKIPIRLFFVQKEQWENHYSFHFFFLWGTKDYPRYRSGRVFPFYYYLESKVDNRYLLLTPLYYRETDVGDRDESAAWLYYWGERAGPGKKYSGLLPFYYYSTYKADSPFLLTPLFWYSRHGAPVAQQSYSVGIPIIPLIIWDSSPDEWDLIFFYLMRHRTRPTATLSHALPLYYYSRGGDSALFISPVYYANTSPADRDRSLLWLIYWGDETANERSYHAVFPLYYYSKSATDKTLVSPLYWNFKGDRSSFEMLLPFYLSYQKGDYSLHINAAGLSLSEEKLNTLPVGVQVREGKISVDSDIGWFYNLFRISTRKTIVTAAVDPPAALPEAEKPQVKERRARNRDDSDSFLGVYGLFGIFAYERADHYRHFRLLPLSWLTWDARSDTGVQTILPFYVHYKDEAVRYFVIGAVLPFYGKQQKFREGCTSEITTFVVIIYWDEFDCDTKTSEKTVLWPLVNHYDSPAQGGFRIFPLFWKKWWQNESGERQIHFSPLHYTRIEGESFSTISWLFYRNRDNYQSAWGTWGLVHWRRSHDGRDKTTYFLPVYWSTQEYDPTSAESPPRRDSLFTFAGVFWRFSEIQNEEDEFTMHLSPAYLYFGEKRRSYFFSWLLYETQSANHKTTGVPLIFHRRVDKDASYSNIYVIPFYYSYHKPAQETVVWMFPLFYSERSPGYGMDNFAFIAGRKSNETAGTFSWNALLYTFWYNSAPKASRFRIGYGLLFDRTDNEYEFSWHFALISGYKHYPNDTYLRHHLLPLWWHSRDAHGTNLHLWFILSTFQNHDNGNRLFRAVLLGILYYLNTDAAAYDQTEHSLFGILYYHNKYSETDPRTGRERRFDSYGSLWGGLWHYESEENYKRFSLLTFIYSRTEKDGEVRNKILGIAF